MSPDMALGGSRGQALTMALGDITGYSHQVVTHYPQVSSYVSLHSYIFLLLFLIHLSTTCLLILVAARVSGV